MIWDSVYIFNYFQAGTESFRSILRSYYRKACAALLVFDLTRRESFLKLVSWLSELKDLADEHLVIILVGNKSDLTHRRVITYDEAAAFARENNFLYMECSAKTGQNVEEVFLKACDGVCHNIENNVYPDIVFIYLFVE